MNTVKSLLSSLISVLRIALAFLIPVLWGIFVGLVQGVLLCFMMTGPGSKVARRGFFAGSVMKRMNKKI